MAWARWAAGAKGPSDGCSGRHGLLGRKGPQPAAHTEPPGRNGPLRGGCAEPSDSWSWQGQAGRACRQPLEVLLRFAVARRAFHNLCVSCTWHIPGRAWLEVLVSSKFANIMFYPRARTHMACDCSIAATWLSLSQAHDSDQPLPIAWTPTLWQAWLRYRGCRAGRLIQQWHKPTHPWSQAI